MASIPTQPRLIDRHFRWRGTSVTRLESFSDAVFAIVLALLFLRAAPPETFTDLQAAMKALVPFGLTFAIVGYVWVEQWLFSRRYDLQDGWTTFLNLLLLFLLLFYAYPLKFLFTLLTVAILGPIGSLSRARMTEGMATADDVATLFVFYGLGYGAIFLVLALMYVRAGRLAGQLTLDPVERLLTRSGATQALIHVFVATTSVILAKLHIGLNAGAPGFIYGAIGPLMAAHGRIEGRRRLRLQRTA
jgi:uncharacterized membrane protein